MGAVIRIEKSRGEGAEVEQRAWFPVMCGSEQRFFGRSGITTAVNTSGSMRPQPAATGPAFSMSHTLYFALPDVASAEQTIQDLILARVDISSIHCLARRGLPLGEFPETNILQKADLMPVAGVGFAFGGMLGGIVGSLLVLFPPPASDFHLWTMPFAAIVGAALGVCASAAAGVWAPNSRIAEFERDFSHGNILLMVEVPYARSLEIVELVRARHPAALLPELGLQAPASGLVHS